MTEESKKNIVQTVRGNISPDKLGSTMTHEHLIIDFSMMLREPRNPNDIEMMDAPVTMENLGWISQYCYSNKDNLLVTDEQTAISECIQYKKMGGGTIVDATTLGIGRNPEALARISKASSVNIVMGAGYYVDAAQPSDVNNLTEDEIAAGIRNGLEDHHQLIEGSAGAAIAALMKKKTELNGKTVVIVICGGNISSNTLRKVLA